MTKILSKSGDSLADVYDVEGSIAGIDELNSKEVVLVHEMGATVFSERVGGQVFRSTAGVLLQNVAWDVLITTLQPNVTRILGVVVIVDTPDRIDRCTVSIRDPVLGQEIPIFMFDDGLVPISTDIRIEDGGGGASGSAALNSMFPPMPSMAFGANQPIKVPDIAFRGTTTAFGAGNVTPTLLIYLVHSELGGVSSRGLPLPSW